MNVGYFYHSPFPDAWVYNSKFNWKTNKQTKKTQPSKFPLSTTSFCFHHTCQPISPRGNSHLPPSSFLLSSCNLVPHPQTQGALRRQSFLSPVLRLLFQRLKKQRHMSTWQTGNPDSCLIFPSTCLVTLGKFLPITNLDLLICQMG